MTSKQLGKVKETNWRPAGESDDEDEETRERRNMEFDPNAALSVDGHLIFPKKRSNRFYDDMIVKVASHVKPDLEEFKKTVTVSKLEDPGLYNKAEENWNSTVAQIMNRPRNPSCFGLKLERGWSFYFSPRQDGEVKSKRKPCYYDEMAVLDREAEYFEFYENIK